VIWGKSSYSSDTANCVEVAHLPDGIGVRDSKDPHGPHLTFDRRDWRAFLNHATDGTDQQGDRA
jgi:hypothetical protein